jgi:hypothetical protein
LPNIYSSILFTSPPDEDSVCRVPALLIIRTVYHSSEYKSLRIMQETSSVCELSGIPVSGFNKRNVYDLPLSFYKIRQEPETRLSDRTSRLFNLQDRIVLFDLTDSHFEGRKEELPAGPVRTEQGDVFGRQAGGSCTGGQHGRVLQILFHVRQATRPSRLPCRT